MINVGDGSSAHPSRTTFLDIPVGMNMNKLQSIDKMCGDLLGIMTRKHQELLQKVNPRASQVSLTPSVMAQDSRIYEVMAEKLLNIANQPDPYPVIVSTMASACQCVFIVTLFFRGTVSDVIMASFFGAMTNLVQMIADKQKMTQATPIFVALFTSFCCRIIQHPYLWAWANTKGVCHDSVTIAALALYMAGFQFT